MKMDITFHLTVNFPVLNTVPAAAHFLEPWARSPN